MKTPGQIAYEEDVRRKPNHHDGTPRRTWAELDHIAQWSWERDPTPREWPSASPWPKSGDQMRFLGENGYPYELEAALNTFTRGDVVTVHHCDVGGWSHAIEFREHPGRRWNGVMFERLPTPPKVEAE